MTLEEFRLQVEARFPTFKFDFREPAPTLPELMAVCLCFVVRYQEERTFQWLIATDEDRLYSVGTSLDEATKDFCDELRENAEASSLLKKQMEKAP